MTATASASRFVARTPEDLLAVVPAVLGFHPQESLVLLTFGGRRAFHARVDLPTTPDDVKPVIDMLLTPALRHRPDKVLFIAYTEDASRGASVALEASDAFDAHGFKVIKPLRSDGTSWWHVAHGEDPSSAEQHAYDVRTHALTATGVMEGRVTLASRTALAASIAEDRVASAPVMAAWLSQVQLEQHDPDQDDVRALVARGLAEAGALSDHDVARLTRACLDPVVRDAAWCDLRSETVEEHVELWRGVVVRTPDELVSGAAAVLAFAAWLAGHGALAWCALDRAFASDPQCSLARLVSDMLQSAVPPTAWSDIAGAAQA